MDILLAANGDVRWLMTADPGTIEALCGDPAIAQYIQSLGELVSLTLRAQLSDRPLIDNVPRVIDYLGFTIGSLSNERLVILYLDAKLRVVDVLQFDGAVDSVAINTRAVVLRAILVGAAGVVLAHNHPSGDHTPSKADIDVTRNISRALKSVDVRLHDHIIVGRGPGYSSMRERNLL